MALLADVVVAVAPAAAGLLLGDSDDDLLIGSRNAVNCPFPSLPREFPKEASGEDDDDGRLARCAGRVPVVVCCLLVTSPLLSVSDKFTSIPFNITFSSPVR